MRIQREMEKRENRVLMCSQSALANRGLERLVDLNTSKSYTSVIKLVRNEKWKLQTTELLEWRIDGFVRNNSMLDVLLGDGTPCIKYSHEEDKEVVVRAAVPD